MMASILKQLAGRRGRPALSPHVTAVEARSSDRARRFAPSRVIGLCVAVAVPALAFGHHSFAVFFDGQKSITITGVVTEYKFVNPHGVIVLNVKNKDGVVEQWKVETNSPSILRRRGWAPDTLKAGETITVEGWPGRRDMHYARLRSAKRADGTPIGKPFGSED